MVDEMQFSRSVTWTKRHAYLAINIHLVANWSMLGMRAGATPETPGALALRPARGCCHLTEALIAGALKATAAV